MKNTELTPEQIEQMRADNFVPNYPGETYEDFKFVQSFLKQSRAVKDECKCQDDYFESI
jgi:hypothetical protein